MVQLINIVEIQINLKVEFGAIQILMVTGVVRKNALQKLTQVSLKVLFQVVLM